MLFEDNEFDINLELFMPDIVINRNPDILDATEGFLRGNMFKKEYLPYKNLTYLKLNPTTEKEAMLYKVMALAFAVNDLNLYLDLQPEDKETFKLFKKYIDEKKELCKEYEKKYGPLELDKTTGAKYDWDDSPWPWDYVGGSKYV